MERFKISQVAKETGLSPTAIYKKIKTSSELFQNHLSKEKGITYLDKEGFELVKRSIQKPMPEPVFPGSELVQSLQRELDRKQSIIESLISQHTEERQRSAEERARADTIILRMSQDIQKLLESSKVPEVLPDSPPAVEPWQPAKKTPAPLSFLEKVWFQLWEPERLRQTF